MLTNNLPKNMEENKPYSRAAYRNLGQGGQNETIKHFSRVYAQGVFKVSTRNNIEHLEQKASQNIYLKYMYMLYILYHFIIRL